LTYGSQGNGTFQHLAGEWFKSTTGTDLLHVPYKDYAQILTDLSSGRISMLFDSTGAVLSHVQNGRLRALAITGETRLASLPDVPTFTEAGLAGYDAHVNYGIFAPAATPGDVINTVSEACAKVQASREIQDILARFGFTPVGSSPAEFARYIAKERERWSAVVKATGLQLDI
jgi:tripartite-type tricarboxylate transporter receptor subunit TctC